MSENDPPSTINQISQTSTINNTIFNIMKSELKSNSFPYLNKEKIPEIIIKDENYFIPPYGNPLIKINLTFIINYRFVVKCSKEIFMIHYILNMEIK